MKSLMNVWTTSVVKISSYFKRFLCNFWRLLQFFGNVYFTFLNASCNFLLLLLHKTNLVVEKLSCISWFIFIRMRRFVVDILFVDLRSKCALCKHLFYSFFHNLRLLHLISQLYLLPHNLILFGEIVECRNLSFRRSDESRLVPFRRRMKILHVLVLRNHVHITFSRWWDLSFYHWFTKIIWETSSLLRD